MPEEKQPDFLELYAKTQGDKLAIIDDRPDGTLTKWSYSEFNAKVNRLAHVMIELDVKPGDKLVWCGMNSANVTLITHAARKIGATSVPLNYRLAPAEAAYVIDNSDAVFAWIDAEYNSLFEKIKKDIPKLKNILVHSGSPGEGMLDAHDLMEKAPESNPEVEGAGKAGTMTYTSGTTGNPKGAVRQGAGKAEAGGKLLELIGYKNEDVYITCGPLYHSGPGGFMGIALLKGNTCVVQRKFKPEDWLRLIDKYKVTCTFSAPTPIRMVTSLSSEIKDKYDVSSMRVMMANAAPWSYALKLEYLKDFPEDSLWETYGSTELGVCTILRPEDQVRKPGSAGQACPLVEIRLYDDEGNIVTEPGKQGTLYVRSDSVLHTYYKAQEKFDKARKDGFMTVGDVAFADEEGYFTICDRKIDMIISGGMNIYPAEVEAALEAHEGVYDVAVFGVPSDKWGESVYALIVPAKGNPADEETLTAYARERLASYKIPRFYAFADEIPRNASGKILKRQLREKFGKKS